jgi:hypothetical protein
MNINNIGSGFTQINYGNDWGIFIDIENDFSNDTHIIHVNDYKNKIYEDTHDNNILINLFVFGCLFYTVYFVL